MYDFEGVILLVIILVFFLIPLTFYYEQEAILIDTLIESGDCISLFRNVNRAGNSEYKGVFFYSGEYREVDLTVNQFINLGGDLNEQTK